MVQSKVSMSGSVVSLKKIELITILFKPNQIKGLFYSLINDLYIFFYIRLQSLLDV